MLVYKYWTDALAISTTSIFITRKLEIAQIKEIMNNCTEF